MTSDEDETTPKNSPRKEPKNNHGNSRRNYQIDMLYPLSMHPNYNPYLFIVSPSLNNTNFHSWSRVIKIYLRSKNKLGFINETLIRPNPTDSKYLVWDRCNNMVMASLTNSIENKISESVLWMDSAKDSAKDIWEESHERYHKCDIFYISNLQEEIYAQKQGEQSITQYFTTLEKLW